MGIAAAAAVLVMLVPTLALYRADLLAALVPPWRAGMRDPLIALCEQ
jgi:hypothetical protein